MLVGLVLPPLTQLNTPYPSISYLAQYFRTQDIPTKQRDLGIELALRVFSRAGLADVFAELESNDELPDPAWRAISLREQHIAVIEPVVALLQGRDTSMAPRILETDFLPTGPRLERANVHAFGTMLGPDAARHVATLYLADLADLVTSCIDEGFALARYHAQLATAAQSFDPLWQRLEETSLIDRYLDELGASIEGEIVALSVPFPGNLYGALRLGRGLKERGAYVVMGGGYVNTELRDVDEPRLWQFVDAITYDDGEGPLHAIVDHHQGREDWRHRVRTKDGLRQGQASRTAMTLGAYYGDLDLSIYLQTIDTLNPAHRLWCDGRWNKITIAHGCYWKQCSFCDVNLDYIGHYEPAKAVALADHMERLIEETGQRGFHFVDEAAPPKLLRDLAIELLRRNLAVSFWGNIRFEKTFDADLCRLLAAAGLIAVTGGLETANARLLQLINKGVTVEQVATCAASFRKAGVMVHAYLMYGFPTQTTQETIDSMELVRQLFAVEALSSAFWHRFVLTRHSPIFAAPDRFQLTVTPPLSSAFATNDVEHLDPTGCDHGRFDSGLPLAMESWLQGHELDLPVEQWFDESMPRTTEAPDRIAKALLATQASNKNRGRLLWLGGEALACQGELILHGSTGETRIEGNDDELEWLDELLVAASPCNDVLELRDAIGAFPCEWSEFEERWKQVRSAGLVVV